MFLYIGGFLPRKGTDLLYKAWTAHTSANPLHNSLLVVKPTYVHGAQDILDKFNSLAKNAANRIRIIHEKYSDLNLLYDMSDVLLHPARAEGFGLTVLEALSRGLVVVTTAGTASDDFLGDDYAMRLHSNLSVCKQWPCVDDTLCVFKGHNEVWDACERLANAPQWREVDLTDLFNAINSLSKNQEKLARSTSRAQLGRRLACDVFSWQNVVKLLESKLIRAVHGFGETRRPWNARTEVFEHDGAWKRCAGSSEDSCAQDQRS